MAKKESKQKTIEQMKRDFLVTTIAETVFLGGIFFYVLCAVEAYLSVNTETGYMEAFGGALKEVARNPLYIFPIDYNIGLPLVSVMGVLLWALYSYFQNVDRIHNNDNIIKGSSAWANVKELREKYAEFVDAKKANFRDAKNNAIFSQNFYASLNTRKHFHALNTLIIGATGSGKSRYILKPNLCQMDTSYVITDPKGEILENCGEMLRRNGYEVRVFDIVDMGRCDYYNPLRYCRRESDIKKIVEAFIKNTDKTGGKGGGNKDPFWDDSMNGFLCATIAFMTTCPKGSDKPYAQIEEVTGGKTYEATFANICEFTRMANSKWTPDCGIELIDKKSLGDGKNNTANASKLAAIFENLRQYEATLQGVSPDIIEKPYCLREWENFKIAPEKTSTTILTVVAVRLDPFNIEQVRNLTSTDTLDLYNFAKKKTALFMIMPATDRTYNFLLAMLYTQLFDILYQFGEKQTSGSKLLKLKSGEFVKYFSAEEAKDEKKFNRQVENYKNAHPVHQNEGKIYDGKRKVEEKLFFNLFGPKVKKTRSVKIHDDWYDIVAADGSTIISRKPTKALAEKYVADLMNAVVENGRVPALPIHTRFLIDEFPNIGEIPEFKEKLATMRGYEISTAVICQTITQLKGMYPDDYEVIDSNCPFVVFLGGDENTNNEYLAKKIGMATVKVRNNSTDTKANGSSSYNIDTRELMKAEEFGRMDYQKEIVFIYGEQPLMDDKFDYPAHRNYKFTRDYAVDWGTKACMFDRTVIYPEIIPARNTHNPLKPAAIPNVMPLSTSNFLDIFKGATFEDIERRMDEDNRLVI